MPGFEIFGEEERREVQDVLDSGVLFRYGFDAARNGHWKARTFETELSRRLAVAHSHLCSSGTAALSIALAILVDVGGIAALNSTIFTSLYIFVLISHYRLARHVGGSRLFILINLAIIGTVFCLLIFYQWRTDRTVLFVTIGTFTGALLLETVFRYMGKRILGIVKKIERDFSHENRLR